MVSTPSSYKSIFWYENCWCETDRRTAARMSTLWAVVFGDKTQYFVGTDIYSPWLMNTAWSPEHLFLVNLIHFSLERLSTPVSISWSLSLSFPHQNSTWTFLLPVTCYILRPSHPLLFEIPNNVQWPTQIIKPLITQSSPTLCFLVLKPKCLTYLFSNTLGLCRGRTDMK